MMRQFLVVHRGTSTGTSWVEALRRCGEVLEASSLEEARTRLEAGPDRRAEPSEALLEAAFIEEGFWPVEGWPLLPKIALVDSSARGLEAVDKGADFVLRDPLDREALEAVVLLASRTREQRFREQAMCEVLANVSDAVGLSDGAGRMCEVNPAFVSLTGYADDEVRGKTGPEIFQCCAFKNAGTFRVIDSQITQGEGWAGPMTSRHRDGSPLHHWSVVRPIVDERGVVRQQIVVKQHLPFAMSMARSDAEHERLQHLSLAETMTRLAHSEARYRAMMAAAGDAIVVTDLEYGTIVDVNPAALALLHFEERELHGQAFARLVAEADDGVVPSFFATVRDRGSLVGLRLRLRSKDGQELWATLGSASFRAGGRMLAVTMVRDISLDVAREQELERKNEELARLNEVLERSAKMASLGSLAGALAHEINNPLHFVGLAADQLLGALPAGATELRETAQDLVDGLRRIRSTTQTVLPFVRLDGAHADWVDVNEVVRLAFKLAQNEVRHRARAEMFLDPLPSIPAHRGLLGQLVTNLIVNATQAIDEGDAGRQCIEIRTVLKDDAIELTVSDSGKGVPPELRERIFDPFFTTKAHDGTGLGLALCLDAAQAHAGDITVEDSPFGGATFRVRLPLANGLSVESPAERQAVATLGLERDRPARILLVDDEPGVLRACVRVLKPHYRIDIAEGGVDALALIDASVERGDAFEAVVCDLMMPDLDGRRLLEIVSQRYPEVARRFIICTGGALTQKAREFLASTEVPVLDKPVGTNRLREVLARVIAADDDHPTALRPPERPSVVERRVQRWFDRARPTK